MAQSLNKQLIIGGVIALVIIQLLLFSTKIITTNDFYIYNPITGNIRFVYPDGYFDVPKIDHPNQSAQHNDGHDH